MTPIAPSTSVDIAFELSAPPEEVFPLLCPVREYEWIPGWQCTMVHSVSGVAEHGCVFTRGEGETWITTRYEPPTRIDYTIFFPGLHVGTLELALTPAGGGTRLAVRRTRTATTSAGEGSIQSWTPDDERAMWELNRQRLEHFFATGTVPAS